MTPSSREPDFSDFPSEEDWLGLPCPEVSPDFVDTTWQRIREDGAGDAMDPSLPAEILQQYEVPEPSANFVDNTLHRLQQERPNRWRLLLAEQPVPEPSADFVDRVLEALRRDSEADQPETTEAPIFSLRRLAAVAVAAVLLIAASLQLWSDPPAERAPVDVTFRVTPARSLAADPWAEALSSLSRRGLDVAVQDPGLRLGVLSGLEEGR